MNKRCLATIDELAQSQRLQTALRPTIVNSQWIPWIAEVLELNASDIERDALAISFVGFGGTSLRAFKLAAIAEERLGCSVDVGELLGPKPLAEVFTAARPVPRPAHPRPVAIGEQRELSAIQTAMLLGEELHGGTAFHLLFSVDIRGPLDSGRLMSALARLTRRHESLRTVFTRESDELRRRVLSSWAPDLIELSLPPHLSAEPVAAVHTMLEPATAGLLRPFERPPVIF
jgi:Phosphopantetheine attachment site